MIKRSLALLLALVMVLSMLPMNILAEGQSTAEKNTAYTAPLTQHAHAASGDAHICEHCVEGGKTGAAAIPEWKAWDSTNTTLPSAAGHWYLVGDADGKMTVTSANAPKLNNVEIVICLNGVEVTAKGGAERFYEMQAGGKLTILDCTAHTVTPADENDTGYRAGKLVDAGNTAFQFNSNSNAETKVTWYDGILHSNKKAAVGAAMVLQGSGKVDMYGGEVSGNQGSGTNSAPIYLGTANNLFYAEDVNFIGNSSGNNGGVFCGYDGVAELKNCLFRGNSAKNGGVFSNADLTRSNGLTVTATGCTFTGNSATTNGGVFAGKKGYFTATSCTFTDNAASRGGVFDGNAGRFNAYSCTMERNSANDYSVVSGTGGGVSVLLDSCRITNNTCTGDDGAVYVPNNTTPLTIQGDTYIYGNVNTAGAARNVYLKKDGNHPVITVGTLKSGAKIGISVAADRLGVENTLSKAIGGTLTRNQVAEYFYSDNSQYMIDLVDDKLELIAGHTHVNHMSGTCTVTGCTGHENVKYLPLKASDPFPTSGNYYLEEGYKLKSVVELSTGTLNLCLHGQTLTIEKNKGARFKLSGDAVLNITDCQAKTDGTTGAYTAGKITGADASVFYMTGDTTGKHATVNIYEGIITENIRTSYHASVAFLQNGSILNLFGGEIYKNTVGADGADNGVGRGGTIYLQDHTVAFNMYGGKVTGNSAVKNGNKGGHGAAIYSMNGGTVNIQGGEISGNTAAASGGAIYAKGGNVTVKNAKVFGNTAATGSAIYGAGSGVQITLDNAQITGNTANATGTTYGAIYTPNNGAKIIVQGATQITGNTGGNVYLVMDSNTTSPNHPMITLGAAGLTGDARIGITMPATRYAAEPYASLTLGGKLTKEQAEKIFFCDDTKYEVTLDQDRLLVRQAGDGHKHCACGVADCTAHELVRCLPWDSSKDTLPDQSGYWYLTGDMTVKGATLDNKDVHLCLNGKTVTAKSGERFYTLNNSSKLTIMDCGPYQQEAKTGLLTGATNTGFMFQDNKNNKSELNWYGGNLTNTSRAQAGGAFCVQGTSKLNIYGGVFDNCKNTNASAVGGGLIYLSGTAEVTVKNATISNCTSASNGGAISNPYKGKVTVEGCTFTGNTAAAKGGVIYSSGGTVAMKNNLFNGNNQAADGAVIYAEGGCKVTDTGSTISNNTATNRGGAIHGNAGSLTLNGTKITGNTASQGSAIYGSGGGIQITLNNVQITGNEATSDSTTYGAIYIPNSNAKIIVSGATKIAENDGGNVYLTKNDNAKDADEHAMIAVGEAGLSAGAKIGITMPSVRMGVQPYASLALNGKLTDAQVAEYFFCDNSRYEITLKNDRLYIAKFYLDVGHKHCLCDDSVGACDHKAVNWLAWDDPTSLPTSGNYCLTVDVKTSANVSITGNDTLNLCLNGHTIEAAGKNQGTWQDRIFDIKGEATLNITDCTGKGKLTGGTYGVILFEDNRDSKTVFNLYGGNLTGNKGANYGGAVLVQGGGTMNMYGGAIFGNNMNGTAVVDAEGKPVLDETGAQKTTGTSYGGGAIGLNGNKTTFNMYGGKIYDNECMLVTYLDADGKEAQAGGRGGAIYSTGGNVNIYGGEISGNRANQGGAIYACINSKINIAGGQIASNTTGSHGAGIFADGSILNVSGGKITKNVSEKGAGGIQFSKSNNRKSILTITGGEITENDGYYGGGILCQGRATINIEGGLIARNKADTAGGVYISTLSPAKMTGGVITENEAVNNAGGLYILRTVLDMTGGEISGNTAGGQGGAVYVYGATLNLDGGALKNNTAKNGGGISMGRLTVTGNLKEHAGINALIDSKGKLECRATVNVLSGCVEGNKSTGAGGGMLIQGFGTLNVKGGEIKNNTSNSSGGGVYLSDNCTIEMTGGVFSGNHADGTGGGVHMAKSTGNFAGGVFEKNTTKKQGAGICASNSEVKLSGVKIRNHNHKGVGAGYTGFTSKTTMSGGSITGNYSGNYGGGVYLQRGQMTITGGSMTGNSTKGTGAAIHSAGADVNIYGGYFANNKCEGTGGPVLFTARWSYKENGVKKEDTCDVYVGGGTFTNNYGRNGGVMLIQSGATLKVTGGKFTNNEGPAAGGALYISNNIKFEITGGTFTDNKTDNDGGAINFQGAQGVMDGASGKLIFENNYAKRYGGAFNITGELADVTVKNLKVSKNSVSNRGGGVAVNTKGHANFENVEIFENHSEIQGGGFYVGHAPIVFLKDCKIHHNTSDAAGAGIATECVNEITMENVVVSQNETKTKAGGIYVRGALMDMTNCQVIDNVAGGDGGGIATAPMFGRGGEIGSGGDQPGLILKNCKITGNTCAGAGGGIHENNGYHVTIIGSEISGNTSGTEGSAIWTKEDMKISGITVTGNTSKTNGYAVFLAEGAFDGQSFVQAIYEWGGDVIVKDNVGGEVYMGPVNVIATTAEGFGENTNFQITLDSGVLTNRLLGVYNYERSEDGIYTVTYGNRSITEPEFFAETGLFDGGNGALYVGVGAFVVLAAAAVVLIVLLKKKKAKAAPAAQD